MLKRALCLLPVLCFLVLAVAVPADAFIVRYSEQVNGNPQGIVLGPDGNFWVTEGAASSVARVAPSGQVLSHIHTTGSPSDVIVGPGGRIWVSVTGADQLAWINSANPGAGVTTVTTAGESN